MSDIWHLSLWAWVTSLNMMFSRSIHLSANFRMYNVLHDLQYFFTQFTVSLVIHHSKLLMHTDHLINSAKTVLLSPNCKLDFTCADIITIFICNVEPIHKHSASALIRTCMHIQRHTYTHTHNTHTHTHRHCSYLTHCQKWASVICILNFIFAAQTTREE